MLPCKVAMVEAGRKVAVGVAVEAGRKVAAEGCGGRLPGDLAKGSCRVDSMAWSVQRVVSARIMRL